jgi:hypothetical protein
MNRKKLSIILLVFLLTCCAREDLINIYTIDKLSDLRVILSDASNNDLVLFDVDYVLTIYDDKILRPIA